MKKYLLATALFVTASGLMFAADDNKVPDEFAARILRIQLDQSNLRGQQLQLQQQFTTDQNALAHDDEEIAAVKKEALAKAGKNDGTWDIDLVKLVFIAKPKPADKK